MSSRKPVSWFLTERGRNFSFAVVAGTGCAFTVARFGPNTFFLEKYKDFVRHYSNGQPVPLTQELRDRYEKCLDLLNISGVQRKYISPFSVFGYDLFHAGSTSTKYGGVVGIPVNFTYKSFDDLRKDNIQVNQKVVDFTSEVGKKLADALILPEKVQEFAICREILMTQNKKVMYESAYPFTCLFCVYHASQYLNKRLNLYAGPLSLRATLYSILGLFGCGVYFLLKDMTEVHYETETDKELCKLGADYIQSGVTFYEKILQRNQALRELMGSEGENKYSSMGNENYFIRHPRMALIHRKQFFEQQLKLCSENDDLEKQDSTKSASLNKSIKR